MHTSKLFGSFKGLVKNQNFFQGAGVLGAPADKKCKRCGQCCMETSHLFMNDEDSRRVRKYMRDNNIQAQNKENDISVVRPIENLSDTKIDAMAYGGDGKKCCPLYVPGKGCSIYPARPLICQIYHCWDPDVYWDTKKALLDSSYTVRSMEEEIYK